MQQWSHLLASLQQDVIGQYQGISQELVQAVYSLQLQVVRIFGINLNPSTAANNSDWGAGQDHASGSGSGSGAATAAHEHLHPRLDASADVSGSGSASGSGPYSGSATVTGKVWLDNNGDGSIDNNEMDYAGDTVYLYVSTNGGSTWSLKSSTTTSNATQGYNYSLPVAYGYPWPSSYQYKIQVVFPSGFEATIPGASEIDAQGYSQVFSLSPGGTVYITGGLASMTVNTTADDVDASGVVAPIQNQITLRDAIQTGNNGGGILGLTNITFAGNGASGSIGLKKALDPIKRSYNISGPGSSTLTVNGNNTAGTIFTVNAGVTSTISGLTITDGSGANGGGIYNKGTLTLSGDDIIDNQLSDAGGGGGIYNSSGAQLTLQTVVVSDNSAGSGGGLYNAGTVSISGGSIFQSNTSSGEGGGIYNKGGKITATGNTQITGNTDNSVGGGGVTNIGGSFVMSGGSISNNKAPGGAGGGAYNSGTMTLSGVTVEGNRAATIGGGIYMPVGKLTLTKTVTVGFDLAGQANKASSGGGLFIGGGTAIVSGAIEGNTATGIGGPGQFGGGGGIYISGGQLTLKTPVAVKDNTSMLNGGGIYVNGGTVKATSASMSFNQADNNGGGIFVGAGSLTLKGRFEVAENETPHGSGAGMFIQGGQVTLSGAGVAIGRGTNMQMDWIENNNAGLSGGGIYNWAGSLTIQKNVQLYENNADKGGGMYLGLGSTTTIAGGGIACTIMRNTIAGQGGLVVATKGQGVYRQVVGGQAAGLNNWNPGKTVDDEDDPGHTYVTGT